MLIAVSAFIDWLNGLQAGQQNLVVGLICVVLPGLLWLLKRILTATLAAWRRSRQAARVERERLSPRPAMGLVETLEAEPAAISRIHEAIAAMSTAQKRFSSRADAIQSQKAQGKPSPGRFAQIMGENTRALDRYSDEIASETRAVEKAIQILSDSWSSRMYWHDKRGSAKDILETQLPRKTRDLLASTQQVVRIYSNHESLEGLTGWLPKMDRAVARHIRLREDLVAAMQEFAEICEKVLEFHKRRTGLRKHWYRMLAWWTGAN